MQIAAPLARVFDAGAVQVEARRAALELLAALPPAEMASDGRELSLVLNHECGYVLQGCRPALAHRVGSLRARFPRGCQRAERRYRVRLREGCARACP